MSIQQNLVAWKEQNSLLGKIKKKFLKTYKRAMPAVELMWLKGHQPHLQTETEHDPHHDVYTEGSFYYDYTILLPIKEAGRPRGRAMGKSVQIYNPPEYTEFCELLTYVIGEMNIPVKDYRSLEVAFYKPHIKGTAIKRSVSGLPWRKKPDIDNCVKGLMDSLQKAGVIEEDGQISDLLVRKRRTTEGEGYICFTLGEHGL